MVKNCCRTERNVVVKGKFIWAPGVTLPLDLWIAEKVIEAPTCILLKVATVRESYIRAVCAGNEEALSH